jgi:hypothetical protein
MRTATLDKEGIDPRLGGLERMKGNAVTQIAAPGYRTG